MDHGSAGFAAGQWHGYVEPHDAAKPQQPLPAAPPPEPSLPWPGCAPSAQQPYAAHADGAPHANGFGGHDGHAWQQPPGPALDEDPDGDAPPPLPPPDDEAPPPLPDELPPDLPDTGGAQQPQQPSFLPHPSLQYAVPPEQVRIPLSEQPRMPSSPVLPRNDGRAWVLH